MPLIKSRRKIQAFGTSLSFTLPAAFVKANVLEKGSILKVFFGLDGVLVVSCDDDLEVFMESLDKLLDSLDEELMN